jgi:RNA methyltransferase, TrmH family
MIKLITSIKDPRVILARELQSKAGRKKHHKFLLYGIEQIEWALEKGLLVLYVFGQKEIPQFPLTVLQVSDGILKKISDTNYVIPFIGVAEMPEANELEKQDFVVVLDDIKDYGNLGTIIRTAQGFSVDTFVFSHEDSDPFQRKVIDSSRGSVFQSNFIYEKDEQQTIDHLKKLGFHLVVTSPHAQELQSQVSLIPGKPLALIIGNETKGVSDAFLKQADVTVQIPMSIAVESLNVGVAAGISIYELRFKQVLLMLKEKIFANFGREVNVLGKYIQMAFDKEISRVTSLNGKQVILLMIMHCDQLMPQEQMSKDMGLFGQELDQFLKPLFAKNLIKKEADNYQLTGDGERFLAEIWPVVEQTQQKIFSKLKEDEVQQLMQLMQKVKESCIDIMNN